METKEESNRLTFWFVVVGLVVTVIGAVIGHV